MPFTLASFNICSAHFAEGRYTDENLRAIGRTLADCGADVVCMQEVDVGAQRSDGTDMPSELSWLGGFPYHYFIKIRDFQGGEYGTAILSKFRILRAETIDFKVKIAKQGTSCGYAVLDTPDGAVTLFNTHLSVESEEANTDTMLCLRDILLSHGELLCCGDFNTDPPKLEKYVPELKRANTGLRTYADRSIDNVLYTDGFTVTDVRTLDTTSDRTTDHNMLLCTVGIKEK